MTFSLLAGVAPEEASGSKPTTARMQLAAIQKTFCRMEEPRFGESLQPGFGIYGGARPTAARNCPPGRTTCQWCKGLHSRDGPAPSDLPGAGSTVRALCVSQFGNRLQGPSTFPLIPLPYRDIIERHRLSIR